MNPEEHAAEPRPFIAAVVVTYRPEVVILEYVRRISAQVRAIIVVDNASDGPSAEWVNALEKMSGVVLIRNVSNLGIAAALNLGVRRALQSSCSWVATFDQDTGIPEKYFDNLIRIYNTCPASQQVGMVVPSGWTGPGLSEEHRFKSAASWSLVIGAIGSGSLVKAEVFGVTGFFDEAMFIDYVDTDFCLRLQKNGFKILSVASVLLEHELGQRQTRNLLGIKISFRIHTAWRYYYIMRNRLLLYRRYGRIAPGWLLHDFRWLIMELGRMVILENGRVQKIRAAFQGIKDGLKNKSGRHPDYPPAR